MVISKLSARLTAQDRKILLEALLFERSQWSLQTASVGHGNQVQKQQINETIRRLEKLMSREFILGPMLTIVSQYRMQRFAQSPRNMADTRISVEGIRRQIHRFISVAGKGDEAAVNVCLDAMAPQAKHYIAVSMRLRDRRIGTYYEGAFDDVARNHLLQSARRALGHPHLAKRPRGRRADRAGDALIWSAYRAFSLYAGEIPRVWADGRSFSGFIAVVAVLLELAGDPRHEATLRDRCRKALKQEPKPPFEGLLFARHV